MPEKLERHQVGRVLLGRALRARRTELGLSITELSFRTSLSAYSLSSYEQGRRLPPLEALDLVAAAMDTNVRDLLRDVWPWDGVEEPPPAG
ncbi:helix-turn-helix domain-containing protein [Nocardioides litoris]|uniref:helix-turn-helix domain-containing protein n=1 Tax=Nocardioides litoris TaxID=1926648 RepID=UPI00112221C9|nr:helix-turn-helix transcriptional regulator [Nocardioides litoris]